MSFADSFADSTADSLKLIKSHKVQQKADSIMYQNIGLADTTKKNKSDSTHVMTWRDSLAAKSKDSTARIENFHYQRHDVPFVQFTPKKKSKFFAYPSQSLVSRTVELDSTGSFVLIKEKIGSEPYKILLQVPLDEYIRLKMEARNRSLWEELAYKYELKDQTKDIGALISDITNIDIPLPSVGFLSIFGKKGINIRINGAVDIHGAWRNETTEGVTASLLGNSRNEPDFKQQVQINVQGTIGDKLKIGADWNTERTFEYENQLKLSYTGYEDEIIQKIEAGNVSLQTSPLVGGSEALFGVKANFQLGPLNLTTIASQKKGEIKEVSISGGATTQEFTKRVYDYSTNHYFIDSVYADTRADRNFFYKYYSSDERSYDPGYFVWNIEVWKSATGARQLGSERIANAYIDLPTKMNNIDNYSEPNPSTINGGKAFRDTTMQGVSGRSETGRFTLLTPGTDYDFHPETGYISFKTQIQESDVIAVAYEVANPGAPNDRTKDLYYGDFVGTGKDTVGSNKRLVLKLVKPANLQPGYGTAWKLQLRNIYPVGGRQVNQEGFKADIYYQLPGQEPQNALVRQSESVKLLNAFGLDKVNSTNQPPPDGEFDFFKGRTIFTETGEIIFPVLEPFGRDLPAQLRDLNDAKNDTLLYSDVYNNTITQAKLQTRYDRFFIKGKYSASTSSTFNLGMVGIVENSVKVTLGGKELTPNVDYVVDYNIGQVTIRNSAALVPGADLKITYEQNDIFQLASKTMLGARGEFNFSKKTMLGFSALNLNQQTLTDKVRIGEEPLDNSIYGIDFSTAADLPFLTKGLDKLFSTREMSSLSLKGEFAYIRPDPNTKKSTISSDASKSIAYIDDFEGSKKTIPVGIGYTQWHDLSIPRGMRQLAAEYDNGYPESIMQHKARAWWYNLTPSGVVSENIYPMKKVSKSDDQISVLDFVYDPGLRGMYNYHKITQPSENNWGGMMKFLSSTANNLIDENIEFLEFWVQVDPLDQKSKYNPADSLYIDLGKISEDVIPNNRLDTEDKKENQLLDEGEDTGIDGIPDAGEAAEALKHGGNTGDEADPAGDDFIFSPGYTDADSYTYINGTEKNAQSIEAGKFPDTEDLKGSLNLEQTNSYFRYAVPLDTNRTHNPYIVGGGNTAGHWHQIRIPLKEWKSKEGQPSLSVVEYIRVWINGVAHRVHLRLADFNLVGNQWQKVPPNGKTIADTDSTLELSVISVDENSPEYHMPDGVEKEQDKSKPDEQVYRNEQSLNMIIKHLPKGKERQVMKSVRAMDLFNYSEMKLFVHGDEVTGDPNNLSYYSDTSNHGGDVYFRFGSDTLNYYEYRMPILAGWKEISIPFKEITALKQARDSVNKVSYRDILGMSGHQYRVRGNPALTNVTFFMIGITNPGKVSNSQGGDVSGKVWIDELRVIGADNHSGWAYSASAAFKIADLANVSFNMSQTDPYFHKLSDRFGSRMNTKNWGVSVDMDVIKLIPFNMPGSKLRVNYQRTESISKPLYVPGTDIKIDDASSLIYDRKISQGLTQTQARAVADSFINVSHTLSTSETWSLGSIELRVPTNFWLIQQTINNLRFSFSYNKTNGRNPTTVTSKSWVWNFGANYALNFGQNNFFYLADIPVFGTILGLFTDYRNTKFYYSPQNLAMNLTASRNYSYSLARVAGIAPSVARDFKATRNGSFNWKLTEGGLLNLGVNYTVDISSSLAHLLTVNNLYDRREKDIWHDILSGQYFGKDYQYQQSLNITANPKLPSLWNINNFFNVTTGYGVSYSWQNNFQQIFAGRSAGYANKINLGLKLKLKQLMEPLFKESKEDENKSQGSGTNNQPGNQPGGNAQQQNSRNSRNSRSRETDENLVNQQQKNNPNANTAQRDSLAKTDSTSALAFKKDSTDIKARGIQFKAVWSTAKNAIKYILFDYDNITFNFSQDNTLQKNGIRGNYTGFNNFWGIKQNLNMGPSRLFMLGLSDDVGPRAFVPDTGGTGSPAKLSLSDNYSQRNNIDFGTSKPLWEGAQLDIKWKVGWSNNKITTLQTDQFGNAAITGVMSNGSLTRSFVSLPPVFFLPFVKSGIKHVNELYSTQGLSLSDAFTQGFESLPILSSLPGLKQWSKYIPRPNWSLNWDGLEKFSLFSSFAKRVSLNHAYSSEYTEGWSTNPSDGTQRVQSQKVNYGFQPLAGITMTFNSLWNGNMTGNLKYSTKTSYDLVAQTSSITEAFSKDIGITFSYSKTGFDVPLFGVNLKNDIEISFSYTSSTSSVVVYNMQQFSEAGTPQDGTVRTTMEPRIKYVISSRVTASVYYKRSSVQPEGAARITPTTTNEAGLDVHVAIQ